MSGIQISYTLGARGTARMSAVDPRIANTATAFRFDTDDPIVITDESGAVTLFNGTALAVRDRAVLEPNVGVESSIDATDMTRFFDHRIVTPVTFPSGTTMRDVVDYLVALVSFAGVTRDLGMVPGPALDGLTFDYSNVTDALNELSRITSYPWRLQPSLVLEMAAPGTWTAGFSLTSTNSTIRGGVQWSKSKSQKINRVYVKFGTGLSAKTQSFTATASQTSFTLTYPAAGTNLRGYITVNGADHPLGAAPWTWDAGTNSILHASGATAGTTVDVTYDVQFPIVTSQGNASSATEPLEAIHLAPEIFDINEANQLADALLARYEAAPRVVTLKTRAGFEMPGTTVTLNIPERDIASSTWLITGVNIRTDKDDKFTYEYTLAEGTQAVDTWIDGFRSMLGAARSGTQAGIATGSLLPMSTGLFPDEVIANSGHSSHPREARLGNWTNASLQGPAAILGRMDSDHAFALVADHLATGPTIRRIRVVPLAESSSERFIWQLTQANTPVAGEYYMTGNTIGTLDIGATSSDIGIGYQVRNVNVSNVVRVGTGMAGTAGQVIVLHGGAFATVNAAGSTVLTLLAVDSSNRTTLNLNNLALMLANASTSGTAGAISTYLNVRVGGTDYKLPLYAVS